MTISNIGAAALAAAALLGFASSSIAAGSDKADIAGENGVRCYVLGCFDEAGNQVDTVKTSSVARAAVGAVNARAATAPKRGGIDGIIAKYANAYGVPENLARAVIRVESNYRANARGSAGEVGLMQIKPSTARMMGYRGSVKGLYHPETNIKFGMRYLGMAHGLGDRSVCGTLLKYNAGHGAKRMNKVSSAYCGKVKRHMAR